MVSKNMSEITVSDRYKQMGFYFKVALDGLAVDKAFKGAINAMLNCPEQVARIKDFNEVLWGLIQDCCNQNIIPNNDKERYEFFIAGCTLLEQF